MEGLTPDTEAEIIAALVHYGLSAYDGRQCAEALRELGFEPAAETLDAALAQRIYSAPGVREWGREEARRRAGTRAALVAEFGCDDCGAPAGEECRPAFGCTDVNRTVRPEAGAR